MNFEAFIINSEMAKKRLDEAIENYFNTIYGDFTGEHKWVMYATGNRCENGGPGAHYLKSEDLSYEEEIEIVKKAVPKAHIIY